MILLQKHYLFQTLGAMGQGNGKIIAGLKGNFPDNAISSIPLTSSCLQNKLGNLMRTAVVGRILGLCKTEIQLVADITWAATIALLPPFFEKG